MASFSTISIRFNADLKQFSSQMQNAQRKMDKYGKQMQRIGSGLTLGVTLPVLGLGAAAVKAASDAEETSAKFQTVFSDIATAAQNSANTLRNSYGLSSRASQELLGNTGDLLTGFGFSQDAALDLSTEVNKLAVDLASFTNFSGGAKGASEALTKALLGERESVKSLGISILEADVQARLLENSQQGLTFETERQAKAFATLQLAQEQSKNAIGDYARTNKSFANQMRLVKARVEDVAVQFGEILLPYVTKLAGKVGELVNWFSDLEPSTKKIIVVAAGLAAALGPILVIVGTLVSTAIPALITGFTVLTGPIGLVIAAIAGLAAIIYQNWDRIKAEIDSLTNYFTELYNESLVFRVGIEQIITVFNTLFNVAKLVIDVIVTGFTNGADLILNSFKNIGAGIKAVLTGDITEIPKIFARQAAMAKNNFKDLFKGIGGDIGRFVGSMRNDIDDSIARIQKEKRLVLKTDLDVSGSQTSATNSNGNETPTGGDFDGRGLVESVNQVKAQLQPIQESPFDFIAPKMQEQADRMSETQLRMVENAVIFNEEFNAIMANTAANFASGFAQVIGNAAAGGDLLGGVFQLIGNTIGNLAIQVGEMAIGIGVAVEGIKSALQSLSGPVAIAAGVALVALGTFAKSALSNLGSSGSGGGNRRVALADGGIAYGPTNALIGEYAGARNNPEVVAPLDKLKNMIADTTGNSNPVPGKVDFRIKGKELLGVLEVASNAKSRYGG